MRFNLLLQDAGIDPATVTIVVHRPRAPILRRSLLSISIGRPDLFEAFQSRHSERAEPTVKSRPFVASFVEAEGRGFVFVGLYRVRSVVEVATLDLAADPLIQEIDRIYRMGEPEPLVDPQARETQPHFDLELLDALSDVRWRLVIAAPPNMGYVRKAERLDPAVLSIECEPLGANPPPDWRRFVVNGREVAALPSSWAARLAEWRGIYLVVDESDGARYVGSAYGSDNLLGRWRAHVAGERGVTAELRRRDPATFRFSILERVSPDMPAEDVIRLEQTWMDRLHTRRFGLNAGAPLVAERTAND